MRVLSEAGVAVRDIPGLGGVSKESVAAALGPLRQSGLVKVRLGVTTLEEVISCTNE